MVKEYVDMFNRFDTKSARDRQTPDRPERTDRHAYIFRQRSSRNALHYGAGKNRQADGPDSRNREYVI